MPVDSYPSRHHIGQYLQLLTLVVMIMEAAINSDALKLMRKKRKWTQKQLSKRLDCSSDQVSRWERGESLNVRSHLRTALAKTFGVEWEVLTKPPLDSDDPERDSITPQLNVRVLASQRRALQLVTKYYGISPSVIVGLAPILFLIVAEKSLARRRAALSEIVSIVESADTNTHDTAPHLKSDLSVAWALSLSKAKESEVKSIEQRDLFGANVELENVVNADVPYDENDPFEKGLNPFANYLIELLEDIPEGIVASIRGSWGYPLIEYRVLENFLRQKLGLAADDRSNAQEDKSDAQEDRSDDPVEKAFGQLLDGSIDLRQTLAKRKLLSDPEFHDWLLDESQRVSEKFLSDLMGNRTAKNGAGS